MAAAEGQEVHRAFGHGFEQLAGSSLAEEMHLIGHYPLKCNVTLSEKYCTNVFFPCTVLLVPDHQSSYRSRCLVISPSLEQVAQ